MVYNNQVGDHSRLKDKLGWNRINGEANDSVRGMLELVSGVFPSLGLDMGSDPAGVECK